MTGQIFISYRRDDAAPWARLFYTSLFNHFPQSLIFMDVDTIKPGADFVEAIETSVGSCDVLIAVIGRSWLTSSDEEGSRRLDNPDDLVRLEIATALKRGIRVIPVLVEGAFMPRSDQLPDDLKALVRRNALEVSHNRFEADAERMIAEVERALLAAAKEPVVKLAREYERIRIHIPEGGERTAKMEAVMAEMRDLVGAPHSLLEELTSSDSLGERLAAIAILQEKPDPACLDWLAGQIAEDPGAFHGYQAAVALRKAVHLGQEYRTPIQGAINKARERTHENDKGAAAFKELDKAERELQEMG
jgi:hypothetical protein